MLSFEDELENILGNDTAFNDDQKNQTQELLEELITTFKNESYSPEILTFKESLMEKIRETLERQVQ